MLPHAQRDTMANLRGLIAKQRELRHVVYMCVMHVQCTCSTCMHRHTHHRVMGSRLANPTPSPPSPIPLIHRYRHRLQALFKKYTAYDPPPTRGHLSLKGFAKLLEGTGLYTVASLTPKTVALTLALALALPTDHSDPDPSHNPNPDPDPDPDPIPKP